MEISFVNTEGEGLEISRPYKFPSAMKKEETEQWEKEKKFFDSVQEFVTERMFDIKGNWSLKIRFNEDDL